MADKFIIKYIFFHISNDRRTAKHISYVFQRTKITTFAELSLLEAITRKYDTAVLSYSEFQFRSNLLPQFRPAAATTVGLVPQFQ